jgi:hypothetical protein
LLPVRLPAVARADADDDLDGERRNPMATEPRPRGAERGDAWGEDLHQPPAVPSVLVYDVGVGVPGFAPYAEPSRTPIFAER